MRKILAIGCLVLLVGASAPQARPAAPTNDEQVSRTVIALAEAIVKNASDKRPDLNARYIPDTDKVVYIDFGRPVTGKQYVPRYQHVYGTRRTQNLSWDKVEVTPIDDHAAAFTGWATMREESHSGVKKVTHLIFTAVFAKTSAGWKRLIAQKSVLVTGD